jgi:hypothetical protein
VLAGALCSLVLSTSGCGEPLVAPELVQGNRILGARTEADVAPSLASVAPGQSATLRWFAVSPSGPAALGWAFSICIAAPVSRDLPICAAPSFAHFANPTPTVDEPRLHFSMPDEQSLHGAEQVTANGAFCTSGSPSLGSSDADPFAAHCPDPAERPLLATMGILVARDDNANLSPSLQSAQVELDAASWSSWREPSPNGPGCLDLAPMVPSVKAASHSHEITLTLAGDQSEPLAVVSSHSATRETIQLSHYVTAGELERAYSIVDFEQPPARVKLHWSAPAVVAADGQLVRFYFVVRDGRGGVDWTTRAVCVVP